MCVCECDSVSAIYTCTLYIRKLEKIMTVLPHGNMLHCTYTCNIAMYYMYIHNHTLHKNDVNNNSVYIQPQCTRLSQCMMCSMSERGCAFTVPPNMTVLFSSTGVSEKLEVGVGQSP